MNFALVGLFSGTIEAFTGSVFLFFLHGFVSSALFICVGFLYLRFHSRLVVYYSGLFYYYPVFCFIFFLFV